ncbi:MAG: response regulator transcription factor [bacterium]
MNRILIADDHAIFRQGLRLLLENDIPGLALGEAGDAAEVQRVLEQGTWDLLILDIDLPGRSGLEVLRDVRARQPALPVLMLTGYPYDTFAVQAIQAGATSYLSKDCDASELSAAVKKLLAGERYTSSALADMLATFLSKQTAHHPSGPDSALTGRILEVVRLLGKGLPVKEIAAELNLSIKTVSTYRSRALQQLNLHSTADIVRYCIKHDLVK